MDESTYIDQLSRKYKWGDSIPEWVLECSVGRTCSNPKDPSQTVDGDIGVEPLPTNEVIEGDALLVERPRQPVPGEEMEPLPTNEVIDEETLLSGDESRVEGRTIGEAELNSP
jgi:hypothetical protein